MEVWNSSFTSKYVDVCKLGRKTLLKKEMIFQNTLRVNLGDQKPKKIKQDSQIKNNLCGCKHIRGPPTNRRLMVHRWLFAVEKEGMMDGPYGPVDA